MTEPLFLQSVFQEKIWGGDHIKAFGYDLPSDKIGEYWAISAHPNGLFIKIIVIYLVIPKKKCFHS